MKNFKVTLLSLGLASTVLLSSTPIFATTNTSNTVNKNSTSNKTITSKSNVGGVHNYGVNNEPGIRQIIIIDGGLIQRCDVGLAIKELQTLLDWQGYM